MARKLKRKKPRRRMPVKQPAITRVYRKGDKIPRNIIIKAAP